MITGEMVKVKGEEYFVYFSPVTGKQYIYAFDGISEEHTGRFPLNLDEVEHTFIKDKVKENGTNATGTGSNGISAEVSSTSILESQSECHLNEDEASSS